MYHNNNNNNHNISQINLLGESVDPNNTADTYNNNRPRRSVYLEGAQAIYSPNTQTAPVPIRFHNQPFIHKAFEAKPPPNGVIYDTIKPMLLLLRVMGIFPITSINSNTFKVTPKWLGYSVVIFLLIVGYIGYIKWDRVELVSTAEGRFEEAVIDYLFTVYLLPIIINPIVWYEARKLARVTSDWVAFEEMYGRVTNRKFPLYLGNKPLLVTIAMPLMGCGTMVVTHITMAHFRFLQVVPFCYISTVTYLIGGTWYLNCDVIGKVATSVSDDFQMALKNVGPASNVANYRSLWMMLSKLTRDTGNAYGYVLTFLCLYLFLIITLTIYGLLSQIQGGLGIKDIGLTITATFAIGLLFFICDEAHYASTCVRVHFQKKLLLVELSWMNEDAQQEITMFLRATEMNPTEMSLGGFFDVNRNLFKSLLATMVTYLVVLLQFQISIPEDNMDGLNTTLSSSPQENIVS